MRRRLGLAAGLVCLGLAFSKAEAQSRSDAQAEVQVKETAVPPNAAGAGVAVVPWLAVDKAESVRLRVYERPLLVTAGVETVGQGGEAWLTNFNQYQQGYKLDYESYSKLVTKDFLKMARLTDAAAFDKVAALARKAEETRPALKAAILWTVELRLKDGTEYLFIVQAPEHLQALPPPDSKAPLVSLLMKKEDGVWKQHLAWLMSDPVLKDFPYKDRAQLAQLAAELPAP